MSKGLDDIGGTGRRAGRIAAVLCALAVGACASTDAKEPKRPEAQMLGLETDGNAITETYDLNGDEKTDLYKVYVWRGPEDEPDKRRKLLARQKLDLDFDGDIDVERVFSESGQVVEERMDLDFDGKVDARDYYSEGDLYRRDMALNFEGKASIVKFYSNQKLARKERDSNGDGKMDTFEYYENGKLVRVGIDRDGDEKPDVYTEIEDAGGKG